MPEMNRRDFVVLTIGAAAACACGDALADTPALFDAGPLSDYDRDGVYDQFANKQDKLLLLREGDKLIAISALCTHKSCVVKLKEELFICPCHKSKFEKSGKVVPGGQAKASLFRHAISITPEQRVMVDRSRRFGEAEWEAEGAFVKI